MTAPNLDPAARARKEVDRLVAEVTDLRAKYDRALNRLTDLERRLAVAQRRLTHAREHPDLETLDRAPGIPLGRIVVDPALVAATAPDEADEPTSLHDLGITAGFVPDTPRPTGEVGA